MTTPSPITWTRQQAFLWTGRRGGAPVGTIEQGATFTYIDIGGSEHRGFRSLHDAQAAANAR
jgi:hypothetical protein